MKLLEAQHVISWIAGDAVYAEGLLALAEQALQASTFGEAIGLGVLMYGGKKPEGAPAGWETPGYRVKQYVIQQPARWDEAVLPYFFGSLRLHLEQLRWVKGSCDTTNVYAALTTRAQIEVGLQVLELRGPQEVGRKLLAESDRQFAFQRASLEYFAKDCANGQHDFPALLCLDGLELGTDTWYGALLHDVCKREKRRVA